LHPFTDLNNQSGFLGQFDEFTGHHQSVLWAQPAYQRLGPEHLAGFQGKLGLQVDPQLVALDGTSQVGLHLQTRQRGLRQFLGEKFIGIAATFLGTVHGDIGILHQRLGVGAIIRKEADADAGADVEFLFDSHRRILQGIEDLFCDVRDGGRIDDVLDDDQKFVATESANGVRFSHQSAQAPRHLAEDAIADLVAEGIVDVLEAIEVDEQDGQSGLVAVGTLQGLVQSVAKQQAVGQAGQRVVVGLVIELIVGLPQFGDVGEYADIVRELSIGVMDSADRQRFQESLAVLAPVPEFAPPAPATAESLPHFPVKGGILKSGLQDARVTSDHLILAVTGDLGERTVHGNDAAIRCGDGDAFGAAVEDRRSLLQARLHALSIGDVEHHANQTAIGIARFAIGGFVKDHITHAAVSVQDFGFVHLRTRRAGTIRRRQPGSDRPVRGGQGRRRWRRSPRCVSLPMTSRKA
jgi:hypothetical protein